MFPISDQIIFFLKMLDRVYPDVTAIIRAEITSGKFDFEARDDDDSITPYSEEEQLEICKRSIMNFIEEPCRAALQLKERAKSFGISEVEFRKSTGEVLSFAKPDYDALSKLDTFLACVDGYLETIKPQPSSDYRPKV